MSKKYKTIDLCAGIGGIRLGYELAGCFENVLSAEIDKNACLTYKHLYGENPMNDITTEEFKDIETYTASELISAEKEEFFSSDKHNKDIDDNQKHLLSAVRKLDSQKSK